MCLRLATTNTTIYHRVKTNNNNDYSWYRKKRRYLFYNPLKSSPVIASMLFVIFWVLIFKSHKPCYLHLYVITGLLPRTSKCYETDKPISAACWPLVTRSFDGSVFSNTAFNLSACTLHHHHYFSTYSLPVNCYLWASGLSAPKRRTNCQDGDAVFAPKGYSDSM